MSFMGTKLTLTINQTVVERAKNYARSNKISLSKLIESYLEKITYQEEKDKTQITPLVQSLIGVINLSEDYNYKKDYQSHLTEKYK